MTTTRWFLALLVLAVPAIASAQVEIVDEGFARPPPQVAPQLPLQVQVQQPAIQQPPVIAVQQPAQEVAEEEAEIQATMSLGMWVEMVSLDEVTLELRNPEVSALTGVTLDRTWQGMDMLHEPVLSGAMLGFGIRADGWLRGPELRFSFGGTDIDSPFMRAPGSGELELSIQDAIIFRTELAIGVQAPLGAFRPYIQGRLAVGGAWFDVAVQDPRLGSLGTETVDNLLLEGGVEAGFGILVSDGIELGMGVRASVNQNGGESIGGFLTMNVVEGDNAD